MKSSESKKTVFVSIAITAVLFVVCMRINMTAGFLCLGLGLVLTGLYVISIHKRDRKLMELNNYLSLVCSGKYDLKISENMEGELSILSNNLFKVITILNSQNEMLKKDKVRLADSMADISHQLKTPLTSMTMMTDLLSEELESKKQKEMIGVVENQLEKMRWLILNLLKISKLDAGTAEVKREKTSIKKVLEESIKPFYVTIDLKDITYEQNVEDFYFNGDMAWTIEAVSNIIKNSLEHMTNGGKLTVTGKSTTIYDSIFIKDDGCGIEKEDLPHIFERFYHGKNSSPESVGIGLALAKTILEKEKGDILVESESGVGTTFEIRFYKALV